MTSDTFKSRTAATSLLLWSLLLNACAAESLDERSSQAGANGKTAVEDLDGAAHLTKLETAHHAIAVLWSLGELSLPEADRDEVVLAQFERLLSAVSEMSGDERAQLGADLAQSPEIATALVNALDEQAIVDGFDGRDQIERILPLRQACDEGLVDGTAIAGCEGVSADGPTYVQLKAGSAAQFEASFKGFVVGSTLGGNGPSLSSFVWGTLTAMVAAAVQGWLQRSSTSEMVVPVIPSNFRIVALGEESVASAFLGDSRKPGSPGVRSVYAKWTITTYMDPDHEPNCGTSENPMCCWNGPRCEDGMRASWAFRGLHSKRALLRCICKKQ